MRENTSIAATSTTLEAKGILEEHGAAFTTTSTVFNPEGASLEGRMALTVDTQANTIEIEVFIYERKVFATEKAASAAQKLEYAEKEADFAAEVAAFAAGQADTLRSNRLTKTSQAQAYATEVQILKEKEIAIDNDAATLATR